MTAGANSSSCAVRRYRGTAGKPITRTIAEHSNEGWIPTCEGTTPQAALPGAMPPCNTSRYAVKSDAIRRANCSRKFESLFLA